MTSNKIEFILLERITDYLDLQLPDILYFSMRMFNKLNKNLN